MRMWVRRFSGCIGKFVILIFFFQKKEFFTVTCAVYNNTGTEILASYSDEDVYLFDNVHHEEGKYLHRYSGHW